MQFKTEKHFLIPHWTITVIINMSESQGYMLGLLSFNIIALIRNPQIYNSFSIMLLELRMQKSCILGLQNV